MSRPKKKRCIYNDPGLRYFKPRGIPLTELSIIKIELDEYEAIRLSDLQGMSQIEAANNMKISRGTYQRILKSAHLKIAEALNKNAAIELIGGNIDIRDSN